MKNEQPVRNKIYFDLKEKNMQNASFWNKLNFK